MNLTLVNAPRPNTAYDPLRTTTRRFVDTVISGQVALVSPPPATTTNT